MKKITLALGVMSLSLMSTTSVKSQCGPGNAVSIMDGNNVKSYQSTRGVLWQDMSTGSAGLEIPIGTGLNTIYSGGIWVAGVDGNGELHLAADKYGVNGNDFWPGPIDENTGEAFNCLAYDVFWSVSKTEIDLFLWDGTISQNILLWPGKNNPNLSYIVPNQKLAPFVDVNADGDYNPADGDYPAIKGDFNQWWVMNDVGNVHSSTGASALGIELHFLSYAFATNNPVNNSVFYDVEIINKSDTTYSGTHFGIFVDPDIGGYIDDYIGCDTIRNVGFAYNGDDVDSDYGTFPPVQGIAMLDLPILDGQIASMSSFASFSSFGNAAMNDPSLPMDYYNYMQGNWKDGTPMVYGGNGHTSGGGTVAFPYQYCGLPSDGGQWSECSELNPSGDRRFVINFGEFNFITGRTISMTFATVYHRPTTGTSCESVDGLLTVVDEVSTFYDSLPDYFEGSVGISSEELSNIRVFPNPANENVQVTGLSNQSTISVYSLMGKLEYQTQTTSSTKILDTGKFATGIYHVKIRTEKSNKVFKLVIKH